MRRPANQGDDSRDSLSFLTLQRETRTMAEKPKAKKKAAPKKAAKKAAAKKSAKK
jgi:hypothetical protein